MTSSCGSDEYFGSYVFPTAIIGVRTQSPQEAVALERQVTRFAIGKKLDVYYPTANEPIANPLERPLTGDAFEYAPNPPGHTYGFSMALKKLGEGCFMVRLSEQSQSWTPESLATLKELHGRLSRSLPGQVYALVRAKPEQNRSESRGYIDPEWPDRFESLCDRMNQPDDASKLASPVAPGFQ
ncbi:hypothetical protein JM946_17640 [Steroidobacter sp. S1-65]|uniref:Uncharacterized protein n=1 Tax=Steroidobacter gossypii TaxID=2805490 RepID=A0ABS1X001_9GAMM|nr:hypothetical protein [Steroidobacter gossypii]MBM0106555.1 hypothetical protein [Steroidobacter gossypii]